MTARRCIRRGRASCRRRRRAPPGRASRRTWWRGCGSSRARASSWPPGTRLGRTRRRGAGATTTRGCGASCARSSTSSRRARRGRRRTSPSVGAARGRGARARGRPRGRRTAASPSPATAGRRRPSGGASAGSSARRTAARGTAARARPRAAAQPRRRPTPTPAARSPGRSQRSSCPPPPARASRRSRPPAATRRWRRPTAWSAPRGGGRCRIGAAGAARPRRLDAVSCRHFSSSLRTSSPSERAALISLSGGRLRSRKASVRSRLFAASSDVDDDVRSPAGRPRCSVLAMPESNWPARARICCFFNRKEGKGSSTLFELADIAAHVAQSSSACIASGLPRSSANTVPKCASSSHLYRHVSRLHGRIRSPTGGGSGSRLSEPWRATPSAAAWCARRQTGQRAHAASSAARTSALSATRKLTPAATGSSRRSSARKKPLTMSGTYTLQPNEGKRRLSSCSALMSDGAGCEHSTSRGTSGSGVVVPCGASNDSVTRSGRSSRSPRQSAARRSKDVDSSSRLK